MWLLQRHTTRAPVVLGADQFGISVGQSAANVSGRTRPAAAGIVHDLPDRAGTTAALRGAAKTAIDFSRAARPRLDVQGRTNIDIAEYITRTDNHGARYTTEVCFGTPSIPNVSGAGQRKNSVLVRIPI
jgi:hypothetical protein